VRRSCASVTSPDVEKHSLRRRNDIGLKFGAGAEEGASGNQGVHALEERLSVSVESWFREGVVGVFCPTGARVSILLSARIRGRARQI
jgi:hypothetical protein